MSWCDKVGSVPTVGFRLEWRFLPGEAILGLLQPILNRSVEKDKQAFTLDHLDAFSVKFSTDDGFSYHVDSNQCSVGFSHRVRWRAQSGMPPVMELTSKSKPFTDLLPETYDRAAELCLLLAKHSGAQIRRVGIVSKTQIDAADAPPGIKRIVGYFGHPWDGELDEFNVRLTGRLAEHEGYRDRCSHMLQLAEDPEALLSAAFDWQRLYDPLRPVNDGMMATIKKSVVPDSLRYFEELGTGVRFDAELPSN